jgi:AcrR family transcriptional regulator
MARAGPRRAAAAGGGARSADTRAALVEGAIEALKTVGFAGASAREIARLAGCNQTLVFYHFGSVTDLLLAALDAISERRMAAYQGILEHAASMSDLVESARSIFTEDLDSGHVTVLVEMIAGAKSVPGLGEQVAARVAPWRAFAETAVRRGLASSPLARLLPAEDVAHAVVAGFLGLEQLANLDGNRGAALSLFDRAATLALMADMADMVDMAGAPPRDATPGDQSGGSR